MATRLRLHGSEFQVNVDAGGGNGISGSQTAPQAAVAPDGRFVIAYQSDDHGDPADTEAVYRLLGSALDFNDVSNAIRFQGQPMAAPQSGGLGIVFTDALRVLGAVSIPDANTNITYVAVSAEGIIGSTIPVGDLDGVVGNLSNPDIAVLSTGRAVVVFERTFNADDHDIFLNVVNAAATATQFSSLEPLEVANDGHWQANASVAASGNQALVVYEDGTNTTTASANITGRLFDGASNTLGATFTIANHAGELFLPSVAALPDHRYVIVYTDTTDIWGRIYDPVTPNGAFLSDEFRIDRPGGTTTSAPAVAATADGGFIVTWADFNGSDYDVLAHRFDAHGQSYGDIFTANTLTNGSQFQPTVATSGADIVIAWTDDATRTSDPSAPGIRAQLFTATPFDYDSAGLGDLDGNGRADILFQNDTGDVTVWQTDSNGAVSAITSLGRLPAGFHIFGTGNFNGTAGDDILLRDSGSLAIWPTSGIGVGSPVVIGTTSATYHNAGIGDFTGDGQDDLLFRGDAGDIVTWGIANNALAAAPKVLGSASNAFHIVGIDDFTGDHQADIVFRNDDGSIALWQVARNQLVDAKVIGSTSTSFHVVSTGDFDGNGAKDILFRGDNGELVEWLLDSSGGLLASPTAIGTAGANVHVDGTGDLNGDGRDDIILRDADGMLIEWLMNGMQFAAPPAVMGHASVDYAIAAQHFDII